LRLKEREETLQKQVREAPEQDDHEDDPSIDQATTIYAKKMNHMLHASISYRGERFQKKVFEKLVCEPFLNGVMPNFVINRKTLQECATICNSLAFVWNDLKDGNGKDQYLTRNVVETTVVSACDNKSVRIAGRRVGLNKRSFKR
jgi:hypothetical protein